MSKKLLSVILAIVVMASLCIVNASAAEANALSTKTGELHEGDTVTYTASLKFGDDKLNKLAAINATVNYDKDVLKIASVIDDVAFPVLGDSTVANLGNAGEILFNNASGAKGFTGFKDGGVLISVKFTVVKDAADTEITFKTAELFDLTLDPSTGAPDESKGKKDITTGCSAAAKVDCKVKPVDTETDKEEDKKDETDTEDKKDENKAPATGDVATVVMMLVFAAAVVTLVSKKRA
jgi:hypothetical protein